MEKGSLHKSFKATTKPEITWDLARKLHFIWVGRPILQKYIEAVNSFASVNPNFQVNTKFETNKKCAILPGYSVD